MTETHSQMRKVVVATLAAVTLLASPSVASDGDVPRTPSGRPDLSGTYDTKTLTPLMRPEEYGDNLYLTPEQAQAIADRVAMWNERGSRRSDPNREAPPVGGDGGVNVPPEYRGAAGGVGGYNSFYVDRGSEAAMIDGRYRTSIIYAPKNGRLPEMTPQGIAQAVERRKMRRPNTGTAWWLELDGPGPYDDPELRPLGDRCLLGFGSTGGPPSLPVMYNNLKRIVQTEDYVTILVEMNHDARVIPIVDGPSEAEHVADDVRRWLGDSVGWWEGDTLVVETRNFRDTPALFLATEDLVVTERFTRRDADTVLYDFTVEDPNVWTEPWSGEYPWNATEDRVYEYACHEGNYAMPGILKGARLLEAEALAGQQENSAASGDDR